MAELTARGAFRYPSAEDNSNNARLDLQALAEDVADRAALYVETLSTARPAPGVPGRLHRATDTGRVTWDTGTAWDDVAVSRRGGSVVTSSDANTPGLTVRRVAGQAADLSRWENEAGVSRTRVAQNGALFTWALRALGDDPATSPLEVRGAPNQSADISGWRDGAGAPLAHMTAAGDWGMSTGEGNNGSTRLYVLARTAGQIGMIVRGAASQTADFFRVERRDNHRLFGVDSAGRPAFSGTATRDNALVTNLTHNRVLLVTIDGIEFALRLYTTS